MAKVRRGDIVRQMKLSGRAVLPPTDPGHVWTGLRVRPQQALGVDAPDLHAERGVSLDEVLEAVGPVLCILAPPIPHRPWRLAVREADVHAVLRALQGLPSQWEIARDRTRRRITARPHLAVAGRPLERVPDLEVMIDVLAPEESGHVGRSTGSLQWVEESDWERLSRQSLEGGGRQLAAPEPSMPIDVVYTWVDGSDQQWRGRRDAALRAQSGDGGGKLPLHSSALSASRFLDSDELRASLRSVHRYANWVRRIHIVTDAQAPDWLRVEDPRIHLVDHRSLIGSSRFNSHAIESTLHRIPGLAENYLYLNDDVVFGRIAYPGDYFVAPGISKFFPSDLPVDPGPVAPTDLPIMAAAKNGRDLLAARFDVDVRTKIRHTVHPQLRSVVEQIEEENPEEVARTRAALFRSPTDLSIASSLHHWYAYALGRAVPAQPNYLYIDLAGPNLGQRLDALESLRRYDSFCLNQEDGVASADARRELRAFLDRYLPMPAPWEVGV